MKRSTRSSPGTTSAASPTPSATASTSSPSIRLRKWVDLRADFQGTKLATIRHNYWVAFEVDEVEEIFRWRSIVIHGGFYNLTEDESPRSHELRALAVDILRRLIPETFTENAPHSRPPIPLSHRRARGPRPGSGTGWLSRRERARARARG